MFSKRLVVLFFVALIVSQHEVGGVMNAALRKRRRVVYLGDADTCYGLEAAGA
jgi:hypothetical protein